MRMMLSASEALDAIAKSNKEHFIRYCTEYLSSLKVTNKKTNKKKEQKKRDNRGNTIYFRKYK